MTVLLDDHLLRDWMARHDADVAQAVGAEDVATTNLWYARLCKSAARRTDGALLQGWSRQNRRVLVAGLVALPDQVAVVPMRDLAWKMGELVVDHNGLSTLGAEAVAAAIELNARLLVSSIDDGPGIRRCCASVGVTYETLQR